MPFSLFKKLPEQKEREQLIKKKEQEAYYRGLEKGKTKRAYQKGLAKGHGGAGVLATMSNVSRGLDAAIGGALGMPTRQPIKHKPKTQRTSGKTITIRIDGKPSHKKKKQTSRPASIFEW
jgi:hypothetical protein